MMNMSPQDHAILEAVAGARKSHGQLASLLDFYHDLFEVQFAAKAGASEAFVRPEADMRHRLEYGVPQVEFSDLGLKPDPFLETVRAVVAVLLRHDPGAQVDLKGWTGDDLLDQAHQLFTAFDTLTAGASTTAAGPDLASPDPIALAVGFALAPYLQRAAEAILPRLDLSLWTQNLCPVCGGRPDLALLESERGARMLVCSRCDAEWPRPRTGCPFCQDRGKQTYYRSEDGLYRLYVCPTCRHYLKTVDLREVHRPVFPALERILAVGMDLAAKEQGLAP